MNDVCDMTFDIRAWYDFYAIEINEFNREKNSTYGVKYSFNSSTSDIVGTIEAIVFDFQLLAIEIQTNHNFVKSSEIYGKYRIQ